MNSRALRTLVSLAKSKDKLKFLTEIDRSRVLLNLNGLSAKHLSSLIYSFSKVEANEMKYWNLLR